MEEHALQREFPLLQRMHGPAVVPPEVMRTVKTYRQAVRLCLIYGRRRFPNLTYRWVAAECGLIHQHVGDYFNDDDKPGRRDLPAEAVRAVESLFGNTAISQWHARNAVFTVLEEMQASARCTA